MDHIYAIGDIQGCSAQLDTLVKELPKDSKIICVGDLVNRGPDSLGTLRRLKSWQERGDCECILGNHDLHLLARDASIRGSKSLDTLDDILQAPDRETLVFETTTVKFYPSCAMQSGFEPSFLIVILDIYNDIYNFYCIIG